MSYSDVDGNHPGNAYASEPPPYPPEWTTEDRLAAYWYALNRSIHPRSTGHWNAILADAQRTAKRHNDITEAQ